jgi:tRNA threonylcarbamoyl adenosine modification protein YeaZ
MLLVIDSATAACSAALIDGSKIVSERHEVIGRGHAERLIPMIQELLDGRRPHAILVDCGPGSFTGVRVGLAAAHGLAIGWGVPLSGYSSLAAIAAGANLDGTGEEAHDALPRAADAILLPPELRSLPPRPIYGRAPDAKPMA